MSENEKPLPKPPKTPFGKKRPFEEEERPQLKADEMAMAAAEGRLDEYMKSELPDDENARKLAMMMMGMTGMMPQPAEGQTASKPDPSVSRQDAPLPPDDLISAAASGDVADLVGLLRREHQKRTGEETGQGDAPLPVDPDDRLTAEEKGLFDGMMSLAKEQGLSPDWIISRALKLYLEEYKKTGRL